MNKNIAIWTMYLFLLVSIVQAISVDELLSTYDSDYSDGQFTLFSVDDSGLDTGGPVAFDKLILNVTFQTTPAGTYDVVGELTQQNELIQTQVSSKTFIGGFSNAKIWFNSQALDEGNYNFSYKIYQNNNLIMRVDKNYSFYFNPASYEAPEVNITNVAANAFSNISDARNDWLRINISINSTVADSVKVYAYLYDENNNKTFLTIDDSLAVGQQIINLDFDSFDIRTKRMNGSFLLKKVVIETSTISYNFDLNQSIGIYSNFDPKKTIIESFEESTINSGGKVDQLLINVSFNSIEIANYDFSAAVYDVYGNYIKEIQKPISATTGIDSTLIIINKSDIQNNGPFVIGYAKLEKNNLTIDYISNPYTTQKYDFNQKPLPDLSALNINIHNTSINYTMLNFTLQNTGNADAFNVELNIYNNQSDLIGSKIISNFAASASQQILMYGVNISNTDEIKLIIDINNRIEEQNDSNNYYELSLLPDTSAPIITNQYPTNATNLSHTTTQTSINISTDEVAECKYAMYTPFTFENGTSLDYTNSTKHSLTMNVSSGQTYYLYYLCQDQNNNIVVDPYVHSFGVEANLLPIANFTMLPTGGLEPLLVNFEGTVLGGNAPYSYTWDFNGDQVTDNISINTSYTFSAGTYTINFTVYDADGDSNSHFENLTVFNDTVPSCNIITSSTSGIAYHYVSFNATANGGNAPYNFSWAFYGNDSIPDNYVDNITKGFEAGIHNVTLVVFDSDNDNCTQSIAINVEEDLFPTANISVNATTGIEPVCILLNSNVTGNNPITYAWDFTNDGSTDDTNPQATNCFSAGNHLINLTIIDANGNKTFAYKQVNITGDTIPAPSITANYTSGLVSLLIGFNGTTSNGNAPFNYSWDFENDGTFDSFIANPVQAYNTPGIFYANLTVTDANGDVNSTTIQITAINDSAPIAIAIANVTSGLEPLQVSLNSLGFGGNAPLNYTWDIDNNGVSEYLTDNVTHSFSAGNYTVNLTICDNENDCDSDYINITVEADLYPQINATANITSGIAPFNVWFQGAATLGNNPLNYTWDFNNDSIIDAYTTGSTYSYTVPGIYDATFQVTDNDGDINTSVIQITATQDLIPQLTLYANQTSGLEPLIVSFNATAFGGNGALNYSWDFNNDSIIDANIQNTTWNFNNAGQYIVNLSVTDSDGDTNSTTITIDVQPDTTPIATATSDKVNGLQPLTIIMNGSATLGNQPYTYAWDINSNGSIEYTVQNASYTYTVMGNYTINFTVCDDQNDCSSDTINISVEPDYKPIANISSNVTNGISPLNVLFSGSAIGGNNPINYSWDFNGDFVIDSTLQNPEYTFNAGTHNISLTVTDQDGDQNSTNITVIVIADSIPNANITASISTGLQPLTVQFNGIVIGGNAPLNFTWDFNNDTSIDNTTQNPLITFPLAGVYIVNFTIVDADGDIDSDTHIIIVEEDTTPQVTATANVYSGTENINITFDGTVTSGNAPLNYTWDIDNNGVWDYATEDVMHTYTKGNHTANFTVCDAQNDCNSTAINIEVYEDLPVIVTASANNTQGMEPFSVQFTSNIVSSNMPVLYNWDFNNDGSIDSVAANPVYTFNAGLYIVNLNVSDDDNDRNGTTIIINVTADLVPTASIVVNQSFGYKTHYVQFTGTGTSGDLPLTYKWDFDNDGNIDSTSQNPIYAYTNAGVYSAKLTVTDNNGDSHTASKEIIVYGFQSTYTCKVASIDWSTNQYIDPSTIVVNGIMKNASPIALFTVPSGVLLPVTNGHPDYTEDTDLHYFDSGLLDCSGTTCALQSTDIYGQTYNTDCAYNAGYQDWTCLVLNQGNTRAYYYKPSENRVTIANYLKKA